MKPQAKVTLCIPLYNAEKTIARTLESLINQIHPVYKIKIYDNLSSDNSKKICLDFAKIYPHIEIYESETNSVAEENFTKCILGAEGDYCALVHSDDLYLNDFVSKSIEVLENSSETVATFCSALEIDSDEKIIGERFLPKELTKTEITFLNQDDLLKLFFKYSNFITCPSVIVRSSVYVEKIKFWNGQKFKTSADLDVWLRLSQFGKIAAIRTPLMKYRVAEASYSYRIAKTRLSKHNLFLVLDQYKKNENNDDYNFLLLKDQSIRSLNMIRSHERSCTFPNEAQLDLFLLIKKMTYSRWHFKYGLAILVINGSISILKLIGWNRSCKK